MSDMNGYYGFNPGASSMFQQPQQSSWQNFGQQYGVLPDGFGSNSAMNPALLGSTGAGGGGGWNWLSTADQQGVLGPMLGAAGGLANVFMGMKQYGLQKETLKASKDQFAKSYAAQKNLTNASLEGRQRARVASNPGAYESVSDYMAKYGIK